VHTPEIFPPRRIKSHSTATGCDRYEKRDAKCKHRRSPPPPLLPLLLLLLRQRS